MLKNIRNMSHLIRKTNTVFFHGSGHDGYVRNTLTKDSMFLLQTEQCVKDGAQVAQQMR